MMTRQELLGAIRDMAQTLLDGGRFAAYHECFGEIDRFDLRGVSDKELRRLYDDLSRFNSVEGKIVQIEGNDDGQ